MSRPAATALLSGPRYFTQDALMFNDVEVEPALCAAEIPGMRDESLVKGVRFDVGAHERPHSSLPAKQGEAFNLGPAYLRKCVAARAAARQRAIDLASVVD